VADSYEPKANGNSFDAPEGTEVSTRLRILRSFFDEIVSDLQRRHEFAFERVGFIACRSGTVEGGTLLLPTGYDPVLDGDYLPDETVGARIGSNAIRRAMQHALENDVTMLHVHFHGNNGRPFMSGVDKRESQKLVPAFFNVRPGRPHGALILSRDSAALWLWEGKEQRACPVDDISIVGNPMRLVRSEAQIKNNPALIRQSFLGKNADPTFQTVRVAVVGLGGGGSHVVQQLVHLGVTHFLLLDPDTVERSNLNRLVGATFADIENSTKKVDVAERYIRGVNPKAIVEKFDKTWQDSGAAVRNADVIFGCVDSYGARQELESTARRYFIPYLDIGMDVTRCEGRHFISGQVILSMPGQRCMKCMGFLTDEKLAQEAAQYGEAGDHPQVVWANGVLASTVVGKFVQLATDWAGSKSLCVYDSYDGNSGRMAAHPRIQYSDKLCSHHPFEAAGDPLFT
jgi:hypothetical protein